MRRTLGLRFGRPGTVGSISTPRTAACHAIGTLRSPGVATIVTSRQSRALCSAVECTRCMLPLMFQSPNGAMIFRPCCADPPTSRLATVQRLCVGFRENGAVSAAFGRANAVVLWKWNAVFRWNGCSARSRSVVPLRDRVCTANAGHAARRSITSGKCFRAACSLAWSYVVDVRCTNRSTK